VLGKEIHFWLNQRGGNGAAAGAASKVPAARRLCGSLPVQGGKVQCICRSCGFSFSFGKTIRIRDAAEGF